ncbi:uncharacterized protein BDW43DRAFT_234668 [Aspergillus alliaceus]|uniref:uncharacterized protein n=1 Tax=Petromyces alliaceus TaxID=209559 RepID=UPI0012A3C7E2|nr:uncharacterized protein BDW43DRAFT_234668 [Aspergillus alliaceus]KAB8227925.1 hypothetical protein BDW43DRAFT_234668 [Aspergillus alliaceus]
MYVNLNNISFYRQPPPPKPPLSSLPTPRWMPYQAPPASQCLSHPLPPKPPIPAASTVPTLASRQNLVQQLQTSIREDIESHITTVRNEFDVELERISIAGNTRTVHEADLERSGDHGFHNGGVTDVHPKPNTSSIGMWDAQWTCSVRLANMSHQVQ